MSLEFEKTEGSFSVLFIPHQVYSIAMFSVQVLSSLLGHICRSLLDATENLFSNYLV
jgi:hypothetical protein